MVRETITCPHCNATVKIRLDYTVDADIYVDSYEETAKGHPSEAWTSKALAAIPPVVTKVPA